MTIPPPLSPDEPMRLQALRNMNIVDTPLEERFERITRMAQRLLDCKIAAVSLIEADRQWFKSIQGCTTTQTSRDVSFCGHAILQEEIFVVEDAREDPRFTNNPLVTGHPNVVFYAGCPVHAEDGSRVGMMCVNDSRPRQLAADEAQILCDLAGLVETELRSASASAVQASLIEDVSTEKRRGMIDELTRLWNRAGIMPMAKALHTECANGAGAYALAMLDLDEFKPINDTLGHAAGDEVLRVAARRMLGVIRDSDVVGRLGGDEFLILLSPCASEDEAVGIVSRIIERLSSEPVKTPAGLATIKASAGVRRVEPGTTQSFDEVIEDGDRALYDSKGAGKNRASAATMAPKAA